MNEELLSVKGAARMLGMCDATVYQMAKRGELPTVRIGRSVRIPATALAQWIRANVRNDAPSASDRGTWPDRCLQRAFVEGAQWWSLKSSGWTMWSAAPSATTAVDTWGRRVLSATACSIAPSRLAERTA